MLVVPFLSKYIITNPKFCLIRKHGSLKIGHYKAYHAMHAFLDCLLWEPRQGPIIFNLSENISSCNSA